MSRYFVVRVGTPGEVHLPTKIMYFTVRVWLNFKTSLT